MRSSTEQNSIQSAITEGHKNFRQLEKKKKRKIIRVTYGNFLSDLHSN